MGFMLKEEDVRVPAPEGRKTLILVCLMQSVRLGGVFP